MSKTTRRLRYVKSNSFQAFTASGLVGGITPSGKVRMNFYEDLPQIPEFSNLDIDDNTGQIINDESLFNKDFDSIREVVCGMTIDLELAKSIYVWLGNTIKQYDDAILKVPKK